MPFRAKILAVDDEPELTDLMQYHLVRAGHDVTVAANGWEAIHAVRESRPDIILLDLMLPDMDGFAVCEQLKRHRETNLVPVIMVTALNDANYRATGVRVDANSSTRPSTTRSPGARNMN